MTDWVRAFSEYIAAVSGGVGVALIAALIVLALSRVTFPALRQLWHRASPLGRLFGTLLFLVCSINATTKAPSRNAPKRVASVTSQVVYSSDKTDRVLTVDDFARGFVQTRIGTNETFDFNPPDTAEICSDWKSFGAAEDWFYLSLSDWAFPVGTNKVTRMRVHSNGRVDLWGGGKLLPLATNLGLIPKTSQFWHYLTPSNTLQLTWQNALYNRAAETPISIQAELSQNGTFTYRYDFSSLNSGTITNILVGAAFLGKQAGTTNALPISTTSISYYPLMPEDAGNPDRDEDGNLLADEAFSYTYDAANRLKTVSTNGILVLMNFYDAKSRRVKKITPNATTTFIYDDWNLVKERISYTNGTTSIVRYFWGKDLSGDLQGAGGIGGLLYLTIDGTVYIPCYDNMGNIMRYLDAGGNTVAQYTYDAFGDCMSKSGSLADIFHLRFSTKYFDIETGLYYYGYRFYHPSLKRWLTRDPIEEEGGINLYAFCGNCPVMNVDSLGEDIYLYTGNDSGNPFNDALHQTVVVDTWSNDCPPKKTGVRGFSFGFCGEWGWNWPNGEWLGRASISLPGYWMIGEIYEASVVGKVVKTKKTTPKQDKVWLKNMESRVGTKDVYSVGRHNCRAFSQAEFDKVQQKED